MRLVRKVLVGATILTIIFGALVLFLKPRYVVPILMYHRIDENSTNSRLSVSPESFERQMEFLKSRGYNVVSLGELIDLIKKRNIPYKTVAITFDDGYENNFISAYPVLKRLGFPATIFIIVALVSQPEYMTWDQIRELSENGIDIGSHTMTHAWLPDLDDKGLQVQLVDSKRALESHLEKRVDFISYPLGGFNRSVLEKVREAGYKGGCATNPPDGYPDDDIYALKRLRISKTSDNLFVFWIETSGFYTWLKELRDED